jgi:hypothetical protein
MTEVTFAFIDHVKNVLQSFNLSLTLSKEDHPNEARLYNVNTPDGPTEVFVHRTSRSLNTSVHEYRVRVNSHMQPPFPSPSEDANDTFNRFATLASVELRDQTVLCQCLIPTAFPDTTAAVLSTAIAAGRHSLMGGVLNRSASPDSDLQRLSKWTDLDFEQIHYDHAHLATGILGHRTWTITLSQYNRLELTAVHNNPYWGGGLLCLLSTPKHSVSASYENFSASILNSWSNLLGTAPTFGAWTTDGDRFVFIQFIPNFLKECLGITDLIVHWALTRSAELPLLVRNQREYLLRRKL